MVKEEHDDDQEDGILVLIFTWVVGWVRTLEFDK